MLAHPFLYQALLWQVGVDFDGKFDSSFRVQASSKMGKGLPYFLLISNAISSDRDNDHQCKSSLPKVFFQLHQNKHT